MSNTTRSASHRPRLFRRRWRCGGGGPPGRVCSVVLMIPTLGTGRCGRAQRKARGGKRRSRGGLRTLVDVANLLVVEDDETIGGALSRSLRAHGHDVVWHRGGRTALREAERQDFELVLLDLGLPDLDGVEVCRRLRGAQPAAVIVMLTARTDEMDVVVGLEAGADDYLPKPVGLAELHARLRAHLRRGAPATPSAPAASM